MKLNYKIEPLKFKTLEVLPLAWKESDFKALLEIMEYGDTTDLNAQELKEMCLLSITDLDPPEAAKLILQYIFKERLTSGQIENIAHEMTEEKMWEEYAELSMHEEFFNATQLLYLAYNGKFPHPQAVEFKVKITPKEKVANTYLVKGKEIAIIQLLVKGMPDNTLINRLFEDQLENGVFPDAKDIIWQYKMETTEDGSTIFEIISSEYWFRDFKYVESYDTELLVEEVESTS